jgi:hypothetical protein
MLSVLKAKTLAIRESTITSFTLSASLMIGSRKVLLENNSADVGVKAKICSFYGFGIMELYFM